MMSIGLILGYRYFKKELLKIQARIRVFWDKLTIKSQRTTQCTSKQTQNELLDDHRGVEPPDPIPNSEVKSAIADGSVGDPMWE